MNRLQKKCLIASAALHVLLGVILLVGPAFFVEIKKPAPALPVLEMIPSIAVDRELYGGGNPTVKSPPAAAPVAPAPAPPLPAPVVQKPTPVPPAPPKVVLPPKREPAPAPVEKETVKPVDVPKKKVAKVDLEPAKPDKAKPAPKSKKPEIKVNLDAVVTHPAEDQKAREKARAKERQRREQEQAKATQAREEYEAAVAAQQRRAEQIDQRLNQSMNNLVGGLSSGTTVEMPGPGGAAFANFAQIIKSIYDKAWLVRDDITNTRATVDVEIVVRRDGRVMSARIIRPSGNPALDKSVREALDRVRSIVPFPEGATEVERHFKLGFNLQTKRLTG